MNYYGTNVTFLSKKQGGKIDNVHQLPFHIDKDFQQLNFFMQMLIASIVYIAGFVCLFDLILYVPSTVFQL